MPLTLAVPHATIPLIAMNTWYRVLFSLFPDVKTEHQVARMALEQGILTHSEFMDLNP